MKRTLRLKRLSYKAWKRSQRWWRSKLEEPSPYAYAWRMVTRQFYEEHCSEPCPYYYNVRSEEEGMLRMICRNRTYTAISDDRGKSHEELQKEREQAYKCPSA